MSRRADLPDDPEIAAMLILKEALEPLDADVRGRVLRWAGTRYGTSAGTMLAATTGRERAEVPAPSARVVSTGGLESFATLAELMAACPADSDDRRVLVAACFMSRRNEAGQFMASEVNAELKHLGHAAANITRTLDTLIAQRPALVVQVRKSGKSRQARKTYKVTSAGEQEVQRLLGGLD